MEKVYDIIKNKVVGAQLVIYSDSKQIQYNYGKSSLIDNKEVLNDTIFRIASISKVVVSMAALKLTEEGKLDINSDISSIFGFKIRNPKYPNDIITPKMLMLHTSSIIDGYNDEDLTHEGIEKGYNGVNGRTYYVPLEDLLSNETSKYYTDKTFADYRPGEKFSYSNFGTGILACIVEICSGKLFNDYVTEVFFNPLKIYASFKANQIKNPSKISDTFYYDNLTNKFITSRTGKSFVENTYINYPHGQNFRGPAGGLFISMPDLVKIMKVLLHDGVYEDIQLLKKETVDLMLSMHYLGPDEDYLAKGLQLKFIDAVDSILLKGHTGSAYGVSSFMFFSKEADFGVCFIANGGNFKDHKLGLNDNQYKILEFAQKTYLKEVIKVVTIDQTLNVNLNNRKIILNQPKQKYDCLYLSIMDLANVLDVIPRINKEEYFINGIKISMVDEYVCLEDVLKILKIKYLKEKGNYQIYLTKEENL
ncbi:MAG: serine hydrolase [Acholeplasmataceae bacterium]|nr:serine hydrolase [Acholeplasmataceae bacterium]